MKSSNFKIHHLRDTEHIVYDSNGISSIDMSIFCRRINDINMRTIRILKHEQKAKIVS